MIQFPGYVVKKINKVLNRKYTVMCYYANIICYIIIYYHNMLLYENKMAENEWNKFCI